MGCNSEETTHPSADSGGRIDPADGGGETPGRVYQQVLG
jgi:hypothetical protein